MVESGLIKAFARHFLRALEEGERSIEKHFWECLDKKCRKGLLVAWNDQQVSVASGLDGIGAEGEGQRPCSPTGHRSAPLGNAAPALSSLLSWLLSSIYRCLLHSISCTTSSFRPCVRLIQLNASYSKRRSSLIRRTSVVALNNSWNTSHLSRDMVLCFHILYIIIKDNPIQVSVALMTY